MNKYDLKIIKKKYGERMSHLCRDIFSTILQNEGVLSVLLLNNFDASKYLYEDLKNNDLVGDFRDYIYLKYFEKYKEKSIASNEFIDTPENLMKKVRYILHECHTEEDIQNYKKYYSDGEELCSFKGGKLINHRVFFAVKENVDEIQRRMFNIPEKQDEYGTSVISIQFTKDDSHILSIKNRYNHIVPDSDSTFSNNLDNIVIGLTESFAKYYNLKQEIKPKEFKMLGYFCDKNGKFYKYNYKINDIYYCPDNIIIENGIVKQLDLEKYILLDYFILDLVNKKIYTNNISDSFLDKLTDIKKIEIKNISEDKIIILNNDILIKLDKYNRIIEYSNKSIEEVNDKFLSYNTSLKYFDMPNLLIIGSNSFNGKKLTNVVIPQSVETIGDMAFSNNRINSVKFNDSLKIIGKSAFENNLLERVELPDSVLVVGKRAFKNNNIKNVKLSKSLRVIEEKCFANNELDYIKLPSILVEIKSGAFMENNISCVKLPNSLKVIDNCAFAYNNISSIDIPFSIKKIGELAFAKNQISNVELPFTINSIQNNSFDFITTIKLKINILKFIKSTIYKELSLKEKNKLKKL